MSYPKRPHFAFPFGRDSTGSVAVNEQDSVENVMACERVIVCHPLGYRQDRPEFGWAWPELVNVPLDLATLEQALRQFEPRGDAVASQYLDTLTSATVRVAVDVTIASTEQGD